MASDDPLLAMLTAASIRSRIATGPGKVTWTDLRPQPLLTIDRIGNGLEFEPPSR